jgi:beta-glucuronidase
MRLFRTSETRNTKSLDGLWSFKTDPENIGIASEWNKKFPDDSDKMCVPSCWNCTPEYFAYEGKAWYRTTFTAETDTYMITFDSVLNESAVFIDGVQKATHYCGFTPFRVFGAGKSTHTLTVMVDNTHNMECTIPLSFLDWYHYGGISGSVGITSFVGAYIENHRISYTLNENMATGTVSFDISGDYNDKAEIYFDGKLIAAADAKTGNNNINIDFGEIERWDIDNPKLYTVQVKIKSDDVIERIGFRSIKTEGNKILLNGRELIIKAVNRHNEHPDFGFSLPFTLLKRDADIIKGMGCNFIRGSHYPNPPVFLDYLDEIGMLFWEEIPMWGFKQEPLAHPLTLERATAMYREMINRDYHHPAIIFWGLHNEIATDTEEGYKITKALYELVKKEDKSRPVTYASNRCTSDICFEFADVISLNFYPGWYSKDERDIATAWKTEMTRILEYIKETGSSGKPIVVSEFGAGAIFGDSSFYSVKWTENYQAELLDIALHYLLSLPEIKGYIVWQFCDIRTSFELALSRPRSFNNKGIVNEYRKPKMAYYTVKKIYDQI